MLAWLEQHLLLKTMRKKIKSIIEEETNYYFRMSDKSRGEKRKFYLSKYDLLIKCGNVSNVMNKEIPDQFILERMQKRIAIEEYDKKYQLLKFNEREYALEGSFISYEDISSHNMMFLSTKSFDQFRECILVIPSPEEEMEYYDLEMFNDLVRSANSTTKIAISKIRTPDEYQIIKRMILEINHEIEEIGLMIDTESTYEFIEEYSGFDFAVIDPIAIWKESFDGNFEGEVAIEQVVREIHQCLRQKKIKHCVLLNEWATTKCIKKMINKGIRGFVHEHKDYNRLIDEVEKFIRSRGLYIKR